MPKRLPPLDEEGRVENELPLPSDPLVLVLPKTLLPFCASEEAAGGPFAGVVDPVCFESLAAAEAHTGLLSPVGACAAAPNELGAADANAAKPPPKALSEDFAGAIEEDAEVPNEPWPKAGWPNDDFPNDDCPNAGVAAV